MNRIFSTEISMATAFIAMVLLVFPVNGYTSPKLKCNPANGVASIDIPNGQNLPIRFGKIGKNKDGVIIWGSSINAATQVLQKIVSDGNGNPLKRLKALVGSDAGKFYIKWHDGRTEPIDSFIFNRVKGVGITSGHELLMCGYIPPAQQTQQPQSQTQPPQPQQPQQPTLGTTLARYTGNADVNIVYPNTYTLKYTFPVILTINKPLEISILGIKDANPIYVRIEPYPPGSIETNQSPYGQFLIETSTKIGPAIPSTEVSDTQILQYWSAAIDGSTVKATLLDRHTEKVVFTNFIWLPDLVFGNPVRIRLYENSTLAVAVSNTGAQADVQANISQAYVDPDTFQPVTIDIQATIKMSLSPTE